MSLRPLRYVVTSWIVQRQRFERTMDDHAGYLCYQVRLIVVGWSCKRPSRISMVNQIRVAHLEWQNLLMVYIWLYDVWWRWHCCIVDLLLNPETVLWDWCRDTLAFFPNTACGLHPANPACCVLRQARLSVGYWLGWLVMFGSSFFSFFGRKG